LKRNKEKGSKIRWSQGLLANEQKLWEENSSSTCKKKIKFDESPRLVNERKLCRETHRGSEDVANAVLFLTSPAASLITGTTLLIDGGWTIL